MKKLFLISFALLAWQLASVQAQVANDQTNSVRESFKDFKEFIIEGISEKLSILLDVVEDKLTLALKHFEDIDLKQVATDIEQLPEFEDLIYFMETNGIQMHYYMAFIYNSFGLEPHEYSESNKESSTIITPADDSALSRQLGDLIHLVPVLRNMYKEKMSTDHDFRVMIEALQSQEFSNLCRALWYNEVFQSKINQLYEPIVLAAVEIFNP